MKKIRLLCVMAWGLWVGVMALGAADQPMPKAPYVAPVPKNGRWIVTLKSPETGKAPAASAERAVTAIETIKTGDTRRVIVQYSDKSAQQFDHVKNYVLVSSPKGVQLLTVTPQNPPYDYYAEGYLYMDSIDPSIFKDVVNFKGTNCFHYINGTREVWIAVDTMQPVAAKENGMFAYFQFLPAPTSSISLPPEETALLQRQEKAFNAFQALR